MIHDIFMFKYYFYSLSVYLTFSKIIFKKPIRGAIEGSDNADSSLRPKGPMLFCMS